MIRDELESIHGSGDLARHEEQGVVTESAEAIMSHTRALLVGKIMVPSMMSSNIEGFI